MIKGHFGVMILNAPVWVLAAFLLVARRKRVVNRYDLSKYRSVLNDLNRSLPVPKNRLEARVILRLIEWSVLELAALDELIERAGVSLVGVVEK